MVGRGKAGRTVQVLLAAAVAAPPSVWASMGAARGGPPRAERAAAVCRGTVLGQRCFRKHGRGAILTETLLRVDEPFKGVFPDVLRLVHYGGRLDGKGMSVCGEPVFETGAEYLVHLGRRSDGSLCAMDGSRGARRLERAKEKGRALRLWRRAPRYGPAAEAAMRGLRRRFAVPALAGEDVTDQGATGTSLLNLGGHQQGSEGRARRFIEPDRGRPIPYLVDMDALPDGISSNEALAAVSNALAVWAEVSTVSFEFVGVQSFGQSALDLEEDDGRLYVQTHDIYGAISGAGDTAGRGGNRWSEHWDPVVLEDGGLGGRVGTNEFDLSIQGMLAIAHTNDCFHEPGTFEEVLAHEIGHALGLAHSSEDEDETSDLLTNACMYYLLHEGGRGARLNDWDTEKVQQAHPTNNTPPYAYHRMLDVLSADPQPAGRPGVNQARITGYDLQGNSFTAVVVRAVTNNGDFSIDGDMVAYTPRLAARADRLDPAGNGSWDTFWIRLDDGTNMSPVVRYRVLSFDTDGYDEDGIKDAAWKDGLPDLWQAEYWDNPGDAGGAEHDWDSDGYSNLAEWINGTNPTNGLSYPMISGFDGWTVTWPAKPYEVYEIKTADEPDGAYTLRQAQVMPTGAMGSAVLRGPAARGFVTIEKVP